MKKDKIIYNFHRGLVEGTLYKMHFTYFNYKGKRFRYSFDGENESLWVLDNNKWVLVN